MNTPSCTTALSSRDLLQLLPFLHVQEYIARFGHGNRKLARQAQSKEKVLSKMVAGGLTEKVVSDKVSMGSSGLVAVQ